ncbi:MAG: MTAP family purine nucleoside phosphorylase [Tissierellia bacterium]|nr:MTAP family purine nucleoside phosphorylase [Tissierellia bacterium]
MTFAIIGGTGFEDPFKEAPSQEIKTPFGPVDLLAPQDEDFYFLSRHGRNHGLAPHKINYRANIWALKELGVDFVYGICAVGSLKEDLAPGSICLAKDFIDQTWGREDTFFDGDFRPLAHLEMTQPYSPYLNELFEESWGQELFRAVYLCTQGPRFESAAEIKVYQLMGAHVVGMTNVPEVVLAKELGLHYSLVCHVTNLCTGLVDRVEEVGPLAPDQKKRVLEAIKKSFKHIDPSRAGGNTHWV